VAGETIYVMDGWEAPEWRSQWWAEPPHPPGGGPSGDTGRGASS
jgi:hypothetical protein